LANERNHYRSECESVNEENSLLKGKVAALKREADMQN